MAAGKVRELKEGFTFYFNFSAGDEATRIAYEELVKGNMIPAQNLASEGTSVEKLLTSKVAMHGNYRSMSMRIPFLVRLTNKSGNYYTHTETEYHTDNSKSEYEYALFAAEKHADFLSQSTNTNVSFATTYGKVLSPRNRVQADGFVSRYSVGVETNDGYMGRLKNFLRFVDRQTGLGDELLVLPPLPKDHLGFIRVNYELDIPQNFFESLNKESDLFKRLETLAEREIGYYQTSNDSLNLCKIANHRRCKSGLEAESRTAIRVLKRALRDLKSTSKADAAKYTKAFTNVGKAMTANHFVFKAIQNLDKNCSLTYTLKLEGRKISKFEKSGKTGSYCR